MTALELHMLVDGVSKPLGTLELPVVPIGRETRDGIVVPSTGVSRQHGLFEQAGTQWFYRDTESTNGSWVNGVQVAAGVRRLVRAGDTLQLGDAALKLLPLDGSASQELARRTVLVFARGEFHSEYEVPQYGAALSVGGLKGDLKLEIDTGELPHLVIEGRGDQVVAFSVAPESEFLVNGAPGASPTVLKDRDVASIGIYELVMSNPLGTRPVAANFALAESQRWSEERPSSGAGGSYGRMSARLPFGQQVDDDGDGDRTEMFDTTDLRERIAAGYDLHPSQRHSWSEPGPAGNEALEDRVVLVIGGLLIVGVIILFALLFLL